MHILLATDADWIVDEVGRLRASLGAVDRAAMDEYLTHVREIERWVRDSGCEVRLLRAFEHGPDPTEGAPDLPDVGANTTIGGSVWLTESLWNWTGHPIRENWVPMRS